MAGFLPLRHPRPGQVLEGEPCLSFLGQYEHTLDTKNRLTIPAKFRAQLSEGIVLAKEQETCIAIRPATAWNRFTEEMRSLGTLWDQDYRDFQRRYTAGAFDAQLDAAGRIMLPQALIDRAELSREVVLVGNLDTIEVWDRARWRKEEERLDKAVPELARRLSGGAGDTST
jgi:MraZ protein